MFAVDDKLQARKENFMKCKIDVLGTREAHKLALRKEKIDDYFQKKREKCMNNEKNLEIKVESLDLPKKLKEEFFPTNYEEAINHLEEFIKSSNINEIKFGIYQTRRFLNVNTEQQEYYKISSVYIEELLRRGFVETFVKIMDSYRDNDITFEILWCLINLTTSEKNSEYLTKPKFVDLMTSLLKHPLEAIVEDTLWVISNIVVDSQKAKIIYTQANIFNELKNISKKNLSLSTLKNLTKLFSNILHNNIPQLSESTTVFIIETLIHTISGPYVDDIVLFNCLNGIGFCADSKYNSVISLIRDSGVLIRYLKDHPNLHQTIRSSLLRIAGNLLSLNNPDLEDELVNQGIINYLSNIIKYPSKELKIEVSWTVSNLSFCKKQVCEEILKTSIVSDIIRNTKHQEFKVRKESMWTLTNMITNSNMDFCNELLKFGIMDLIIENLKTGTENMILGCLLEQLKYLFCYGENLRHLYNNQNPFKNLFKEKGGIDYLRDLTTINHTSIFKMASELYEVFFEEEDDEQI